MRFIAPSPVLVSGARGFVSPHVSFEARPLKRAGRPSQTPGPIFCAFATISGSARVANVSERAGNAPDPARTVTPASSGRDVAVAAAIWQVIYCNDALQHRKATVVTEMTQNPNQTPDKAGLRATCRCWSSRSLRCWALFTLRDLSELRGAARQPRGADRLPRCTSILLMVAGLSWHTSRSWRFRCRARRSRR